MENPVDDYERAFVYNWSRDQTECLFFFQKY